MPKKKRKSKKLNKVPRTMLNGCGHLMVRMMNVLGRCAISRSGRLFLISVGLIIGGVSFANYARGLPIYVVQPSELKILQRPAWMTDEIEREVLNPPDLPDRISIFEPDLAENLAKLYEGYPWVSKVLEVRKRYPNQIYVKFELRRPAARVEVGNKYYYVDWNGARLSERYYDFDEDACLPLIIGASKPIPLPGQSWKGNGVRGGLEMLDLIQRHGLDQSLGLKVIDISNVGGRMDERKSDIVMIQNFSRENELRIEWGRSSDFAKYGELSDEKKIANLSAITDRFPGLLGIKRIRLQFDDPYWAVR